MKTLLLAITATVLISTQAQARPGGWLVDILKGPNTVVYNNYPQQYYQQPVVHFYQQPQPVYYYQPRQTYYYSEPIYRPMQPYQHYRHCR